MAEATSIQSPTGEPLKEPRGDFVVRTDGQADSERARARIRQFVKWFEDAFIVRRDWRVGALESYDFVEGDQWEKGLVDKVERTLKGTSRPVLTFNKILPQILALSGIQRTNRLDIRALPRGSNDTQAAGLMSNLISFVLNRSNGDYEQSSAFDDGIIAGMGVVELVQSFDEDLEGELLVRAVDPLQVFPDPESRRPDWDDARFVMKAPFKDVEEIVFTFAADDPALATRIREMARRMANDDWLDAFGVDPSLTGNLRRELQGAFFDKRSKKVRLLEVYYRKTQRMPVVVAPDGDPLLIERSREGESLREAAERHADAIGGQVEMRSIKVVNVATVLGWELLQDVQSSFPTRRYPLVPYLPLLFRRQPWGLVQHLKDPQREINKRRSQALHSINSAANSGWLNHASEGADPRQLESIGNRPGAVVNYQAVPPQQIVPHPLPSGLINLESLSDRDMKEIGVQAELLGQGSQRFISGRAIQARQFGGQLQTTRFFDQLRLMRKLLGELLVSVIPRTLSERRIREIVEQEQAREPEGAMANLVRSVEASPEVFEDGRDPVDTLIERARKLRFDIVVDDAPALPTHRQAAFQQLVQVATLFPGVISPDELLEHTDLPNKDELIAALQERVQQMGPQGLTQLAQSGRQSAGASERLDVGDAGTQAQTAVGGQPGEGGT